MRLIPLWKLTACTIALPPFRIEFPLTSSSCVHAFAFDLFSTCLPISTNRTEQMRAHACTFDKWLLSRIKLTTLWVQFIVWHCHKFPTDYPSRTYIRVAYRALNSPINSIWWRLLHNILWSELSVHFSEMVVVDVSFFARLQNHTSAFNDYLVAGESEKLGIIRMPDITINSQCIFIDHRRTVTPTWWLRSFPLKLTFWCAETVIHRCVCSKPNSYCFQPAELMFTFRSVVEQCISLIFRYICWVTGACWYGCGSILVHCF